MLINEMSPFEMGYLYDDDEDPDMLNYDMQYEDEHNYLTLMEVTESCAISTVQEVSKMFLSSLALCLVFQLINFYLTDLKKKHFLSGIFGVVMLYCYFKRLIVHCLSLTLIFYAIVGALVRYKIGCSFVSVLLLSYLTLCEFTFEGSEWSQIRNVQMLIVMKIMSLSMDYQGKFIKEFPSLTEYLGYVFCPGNCIFGPWVDYKSYLEVYIPKKLTKTYVMEILKSAICSFLFFLLSMCYIDWIIQSFVSDYPLMYAKALEFRASHYFVMYMSSSTALAAGFNAKEGVSIVTRPSKIEFPHSLVEVVIYWNIPMHKWLKRYIFKPLRGYGSLVAVIGTYLVSSLLHGLNYQLSGILLSLGIYTYVEYIFRQKLSKVLNACVSSKSCKPYCDRHRHTVRKLGVCFVNLFFTILSIYHLAYLGFLIDLRSDSTYSLYKSFERWRTLGYESHYVVLATYVISWFLYFL